MNHFLSASRNVLFVGILVGMPVLAHAQSAQDQQQADQRRAQEEAARQAAEQQRQQAEQQRQAMEAARQAEQQRQAAEAAHAAEQQRQAADAARQAEQQQRAQEESARQAEQQRQAQEKSARDAAEQANRQREEQRRREAAQREQNAQRNEEARSHSGQPDMARATAPVMEGPSRGTSGTTTDMRPTTATNDLRCSAATSSMGCTSGSAVSRIPPFRTATVPGLRATNPTMFQGELPREQTAAVVARLALLRSRQPDLSAHPLPSGTLTGIGPKIRLDASRGRSYTITRGGKITAYSDSQRTVRLGFHETVRSLTTKNLKLQRGPLGRRRIVLHTAAATITQTGPHSGYVDSFTRRRGRIWRIRHRYHHGHGVVIYYSSVGFGGGSVDWYQPPVFYDDMFYSWLLADDDLFNYDDTSAPDCLNELALLRSYPDLPAWLVRAVLRDLRQESCDDADADGPDDELSGWTSGQTTPLTDDLLSAIQQRVDEEISEEQQAAEGDAPDTAEFSPNDVYPVTFTLGVSVANSAASNGDADCFVTAGDVLQLAAMPQTGGNTMTVVRTHKGDCARGTTVVISFDDLLQMDNDFRQAVHNRLAFLHAHAGQYGLPAYNGPVTTTQAYSTEVSAAQQQSDTQAIAAAGAEAQTAEKQAMAAMRAP